MKEIKSINEEKKEIIVKREFQSIDEFYSYIKEREINEAFRYTNLSSKTGTKKFTGTGSYEEAEEFLLNGCPKIAKNLNDAVEKANLHMTKEEKKMVYDICGYQASVPRYLQGIPTNMINTKSYKKKDKVITINKPINYNCGFTTKEIIDESVKLVKIIRMIEAGGVRVNLNLMNVSYGRKVINDNMYNHYEVLKIRLKNSSQKLNIAKLAFPLVHPSMLRRIIFRYIEVSPTVPSSFNRGYGTPPSDKKSAEINKGEFSLPIRININEVDKMKEGGLKTLVEITNYVEK